MPDPIQHPASSIQNLDCLSNDFTLSADWLRIPYGDHRHPTGAIQRLTRASADAMASGFHSVAGRLGRLFGGVPIYIGHPDDPKLANAYPDRKSYGWIMDIEAREDGLYLKPKWSPAGQELLANAHYKWFSPFWGCKEIRDPQSAIGNRLVMPVHLVSLGLTNSPNIQGILPLANEEEIGNEEQRTQNEEQQKGLIMKNKLIALLSLANDATDDAILAAAGGLKSEISNLKSAASAAETALANEKAARATAETSLSNEKASATAREAKLQSDLSNSLAELGQAKKAHIDLVLDNAVAAGKLTPAQRPQWAADLEKDLPGKLTELSNAKPVLNTESKTKGLGGRNSNAVAGRDAVIRRDKVLTLVNERMTKTGEDYEAAFANIRKENQALFDEMTQPVKK